MTRPILAGALVLAGLIAYSTSFRGVLVLDDAAAITDNLSIRSLATALSPPPGTTVSGRPFANLTFAVNYAISGTDLWSYHALNLLIHLAAGFVLWLVLTTAGMHSRNPFPESAFIIALIWVVHPLHTEAVTYVVQRVESLTGLLLLLTLYASIRSADSRSFLWPVLAVICCALGMATKEVMVVAPVVVWLWFWTFGKTGKTPQVVYVLPITWLVLLPLVLAAPRGATAGLHAGGWTPWSYLLTQTEIVTHYLRLIVFPSPLVFHYAWPAASSLIAVAPYLVFIGAMVIATLVALVRRHPLGFAGAWFFLILAPSSSIVPVATQVAAEHRLYLPSAAVIAVAVAGAYAIGSRVLPGRRARPAVITVTLAAAAALGTVAFQRNRDYWSVEGLWADTVHKQPASPRAQLGYSVALVNARRYYDAEPHARAALELEPTNPLALRTLGLTLAGQGRLEASVPLLERALAMFPGDAVARRALVEIHTNLAAHFAQTGLRDLAIASIDAALALRPSEPDAALLRQRRDQYRR